MLRRRSFFGLVLLAAACGPAAPSHAVAPVASASVAAPRPPTGPKQRLLGLLRGIEQPGLVLEALGKGPRGDLDAALAGLAPDARTDLARIDGPFAETNPLLHLAAGGSSPRAWLAIATAGRGADDLVAVRLGAQKTLDPDLASMAREIARRAAAAWLKEAAIELSGSAAPTAELCDLVDRAASTLERIDVRRAARELGEELDASPLRSFGVASAAAWELDVAAARAALARGGDPAKLPPAVAERRAATEHTVQAAELVVASKGKPVGEAEQLPLALAFLEIGRSREARELLESRRAAAGVDLRLAAVLGRALIDDSPCPGLPAGAADALVCAQAWAASPAARDATALLDAAWRSGNGREKDSVETYLGVVHGVPWLYGIAEPTTDVAKLRERFEARLAGLSAATKEVESLAPRFAALGLFAEAFRSMMAASALPSARAVLGAADRKRLRDQALALAHRAPEDGAVQGAVLAAAALTAQDDDPVPLLDALPASVVLQHRRAHASMLVWAALATRRSDLTDKARAVLADAAAQAGDDALGRAKLVLLMAEADAALDQSPRAWATLGQVGKRLLEPNVPEPLRLQAVIDAAGALARTEGAAAGAALLEQALTALAGPAPSDAAEDLRFVAKAYLMLLRGREATGAERVEYREKLAALGSDRAGSQPPASLLLWREAWQKELAHLSQLETCRGNAACASRTDKQRRIKPSEVDARVGAESGRIVRAGTLGAGSFNLQLSVGAGLRVDPVVTLEPRLLAVELPPGLVSGMLR